MKPLGLYLHIPFCKSKCLYCDFCSFPRPTQEDTDAYVRALCRDLEEWSGACEKHTVDTVYVGGGTPTVLNARQLEQIMDRIVRLYHISDGAEITSECNPATADLELLRRMRDAGWNRLSIGLQSAQTQELKALGRLHTFEGFQRTWEQARAAGFSNLSADLMFGIPHQTEESFADTLERTLACQPEHLSVYSLIVEEGTPFGRRGEDQLNLPNEEQVRDMYLNMVHRLNTAGVKQYEISNFARSGYESRHNLKYWNTDEYLGFGLGAYSDFGGERFGNGRDLMAYLQGEDITEEREAPDLEERLNEYVMLRMRLNEGIDFRSLEARFGVEAVGRVQKSFTSYRSGGLLDLSEERVAFTVEGMLVSNSILSDVLVFGE